MARRWRPAAATGGPASVAGLLNFQRLGLDVDVDVLIKALRDAHSGEKLLMTEDELRATMNAYRLELMTEDVNPSRIGSVCAHGVAPS